MQTAPELFQELFQKFKEEDVKLFGLYTHSPQYEEKFEQRVKQQTETSSARKGKKAKRLAKKQKNEEKETASDNA